MAKMMRTKRSVTSEDTEFFAEVFSAARSHAEASVACVELLRSGKIDWDDKKLVSLIKTEFQLGRLAGYLQLPSRAAAAAVLKLPRQKRSEVQQRAHRAAISAWSEMAGSAGAPNVRSGEPRTPRAPVKNNTSAKILMEPQTKANILHLVPQVKDTADVDAFALRLIDIIRAFETRNAKIKFAPYRAVFDKFIDGIMAVHAKQFPAAA